MKKKIRTRSHLSCLTSIRMSKNAQIGDILLPAIAIILASIAIYSFVTVEKISSSSDQAITDVLNRAKFSEEYLKTQAKILLKETAQTCQSCSDSQLKDALIRSSDWRAERIMTADFGNFFSKLHNGQFEIIKKDDSIKLIVPNLYVQAQDDFNTFKRAFSICLEYQNNDPKNCAQ